MMKCHGNYTRQPDGGFCFESIHEDKKGKRKFNKRIDEISSELFIEF